MNKNHRLSKAKMLTAFPDLPSDLPVKTVCDILSQMIQILAYLLVDTVYYVSAALLDLLIEI